MQITLEFNTLFVADAEDTRYSIGTGTPSPVLAIVIVILGKQYLKDFKISNLYWFLIYWNKLFNNLLFCVTCILFYIAFIPGTVTLL